MSAREHGLPELRQMETSALVEAIATHEAMRVLQRLVDNVARHTGGPSTESAHERRSEVLVSLYKDELNARVLPREPRAQ